MMLFADFIKDATVADVHAGGAISDDKKKKKKPDDVEKFETTFTVAKVDQEQRMVFGWASISALDGKLVVDKQDDSIPTDELEKAAYDFVLYSRDQGYMHEKRGVGKLVESMMFTPEKAKAGLVAKNDKGEQICGLWIGFYVLDDEVWKKFRAGGLPEFSIGGRATRD